MVNDIGLACWNRETGGVVTSTKPRPPRNRGAAFRLHPQPGAGRPYAFVGLSKIRPTSAMDGVPIAERREEVKCAVTVEDLHRGVAIGMLEFQTAIEAIFDVQILAGLRFPEVIGFQK